MKNNLIIVLAIFIVGILLVLGFTTQSQQINTCEHGYPYFLYCPKCNTLTK